MIFKAATFNDLERFYGHTQAHTVKAVVAVKGDEVMGVAGLCRIEGKWVAFMSATDEGRKDKREFVRGLKIFGKMLKDLNRTVYAEADPEIKGTDVLLKHAGFVDRGEYYEWKPRH